MSATDSGIASQATQIFVHHAHLRRRKVHCRSEQNQLIIEGEVNSFYEKQLAQEALKELEGDFTVENHLTVSCK